MSWHDMNENVLACPVLAEAISVVYGHPTTRIRAGFCHGVMSTLRSAPFTSPRALPFLHVPVQLRRKSVHADAITTPVPGSTRSLKPTELIPVPPGRAVEGADGGRCFDVLVLEVDVSGVMSPCVSSVLCSANPWPDTADDWQSGTRKRPSLVSLSARGMSTSGFVTAFRVRGVVSMTREQTWHRDGDGQWPAALEDMIRTQWPSPCVEPGVQYVANLGHTVHVYSNSHPRRAPPGLYLASKLGTISWSQYHGQDFMLLQEWEVESVGVRV